MDPAPASPVAPPTKKASFLAKLSALAAHAEGLGTCPIGFARAWLNLPETKAELGIDPRFVPVFPLVIGYPAERAKGPIRKEPTIIRA